MHANFILIMMFVTLLLYPLHAGPGLFKRHNIFSTNKVAKVWLPVTGSAVAVMTDEIVIGNNRIPIGPKMSFKNLGDGYFGLQTHNNEEVGFRWFDPEGDPVGQIRETWPFDMALPRYMIDQANQYLLSTDMMNRVRIFSTDGTTVSEDEIFSDYRYNSENSMYTLFIESDRHILAGLTQVYPDKADLPAFRTTLKYFDLEGNTRFELNVEGWQINALESRSDGNLHAVSLYRYDPVENKISFNILMLDGNGNTKDEVGASFRNLVFGGQDNILLLNKNKALIYDLRRGQITGTYTLVDPDRILMTADYIEDQNLFILEEGRLREDARDWYYDEIVLKTFDQEFKIGDTILLENLTVYQPILKYDPQNDQLFFGHSSGWIIYQINN